MNAANEVARLVDDLAARWTDSVLELLKVSGVMGSSVAMELETWHALKDALQLTLRRHQGLRSPPISVDAFMRQIFLWTMLRVARKFAPGFDSFAMEDRLRPWLGRRKIKASEYGLYLDIVRGSAMKSEMSPTNRLRFAKRQAAVGG